MQINWYVISGEDHLGPFSEDVLRHLFEANDINTDTLVWKEGMDNPISYSNLQARFQNNVPTNDESRDGPPDSPPDLPKGDLEKKQLSTSKRKVINVSDLPPLPGSEEDHQDNITKEEKKSFVSPEISFDSSNDTELEEDLKKIQEERDNILRPDFGKEDENVIVIEDEGEYEDLSEGFFSYSFRKALRNLVLVLVVFILGSYGYIYYKNYSGSFARPAKMSLNDYREVQAIAKNTNRSNVFTFRISDDKSKIWLVTNNPYIGRVVLKMKSLNGKILSSKDIELSSTSNLKGKIAEFSQFEFQKGQNLVDGFYEIEVLTPTKLEIPFIAKFFPERKRQFRFIDQVLISSMNPSEFDRILNDFNTSRAKNDIVFWEELSQKYRTLKAITVQIRDSIKNIFDLNRSDWIENVQSFEQTYLTKFGTYFTNFVVENEQAYDKYNKQDFTNKTEVISHYTRLSRLAKDVGRISINSLNSLKRFKDINDDQKMLSLERITTKPFNDIIRDCDEKIKFIQTK